MNIPLVDPIHVSSCWTWSTDGTKPDYSYIRSRNPNVRALQEKIRSFYGMAEPCIFPSGMAAISTTLFAFCEKGSKFLVADELYCDTFRRY